MFSSPDNRFDGGVMGRDGIMLASHVASLFSGQGNSLAIQEVLGRINSSVPVELFRPYEEIRRPDVRKIQAMQRTHSRILGLHSSTPARLRQTVVSPLVRTTLFKRMRDRIAMGGRPMEVVTEYFVNTEPSPNRRELPCSASNPPV